MHLPRISIITITYNDLAGLRRTVASIGSAATVCTQTHCYEHVIVDGGSSDGTSDYLAKHQPLSRMKTFVVSERDFGIYDAMNKGVRIAQGDFVLFLNSGDELYGSMLLDALLIECEVSLLHDAEAGVAFSALIRSGPLESIVPARHVDCTLPRMPGIHQSMVYKRAILLSEPYLLGYKVCGDYDNYARIHLSGRAFRPAKPILSIFYVGGTSSRSPIKLFLESTAITRKYFALEWRQRIRTLLRLAISLAVFQIFLYMGLFLGLVAGICGIKEDGRS